MHQILALALLTDGSGKGWLKEWAQTQLLNGLALATAHPVYTGLIGGVVGMVVVYALRKAVWAVLKYVVGFPITVLKHASRPVVAVYRAIRYRKHGAVTVRHRMPLLGQTAYVGPCQKCGTKAERRIKATAFYGGALRGVDTTMGTLVMGCPDCTRC